MRSTHTKGRLFAPVTCCLVLAACGNGDLSRGDATSQLESHFKERGKTVTWNFPRNMHEQCPDKGCRETPGGIWRMGRDSFAEMKKRGLINIQRTDNPPWGAFRSLSAQYTVTLTDAGKKYLIKETPEKDSAKVQVRTHEFQGVEVVGVGAPSDLLGKKVSIVQYQVEYRSTPFDLDGSGNSKGKGEALFVLYDKGWKLSELH